MGMPVASRKRARLSLSRRSVAGTALRLGLKGARAYVRTRTVKRRTVDTPAVTFQNDNRWIYRRRSAPRRVKRYARKRAYNVQRIVNSNLPFDTFLFSWYFSIATTAGSQRYLFVPLYSGYSNPQTSTDPFVNFNWQSSQQLWRIFLANRPTSIGATTEQSLQFTNAVSDVVMNAASTNTTVTIVTVYHCWARRDSSFTPLQLYEAGILAKGNNYLNPSGLISVTPTFLQVSPFDSPVFCRHFIIKNVREFRISPGNNVSLQLRDRHDYTINSVDVITNNASLTDSTCVMQRYTEGYFISFRGAPTTVEAPAVSVSFDIDSNYRFRVIANSLARSAFQASYP